MCTPQAKRAPRRRIYRTRGLAIDLRNGAVFFDVRIRYRDSSKQRRSVRGAVVLVEAGRRILAGFNEDLSIYAQHSLEKLGVETELGHPVTECTGAGVVYVGKPLEASTVIWAAGVQGSPAAEWLATPVDRAGRVEVAADLTVPGNPETFVIGDTAAIVGADGSVVPGTAAAAKQQGKQVAAAIRRRLTNDSHAVGPALPTERACTKVWPQLMTTAT